MNNSLMTLWRELAEETASWCHTSTTRDVQTVACRIEHEGLSFLTITLPAFGKDFERSLARGYVDRDLFAGFGWRGGLPKFLSGFLGLVFDPVCGRLLDVPNVEAIRSVRQLTLMYGKMLLPCSDARRRAAFDKYIECEQEVKDADELRTNRGKKYLALDFRRVSRLLYGRLFNSVDRLVHAGELVPEHGPGATADGLLGNTKWDSLEWTSRLEEILPSGEYLLPNWRFSERYDHVTILEPGQERPVKVVDVPKTLKTPRIIAMEPTCMMYAQKALSNVFVEFIEKKRIDQKVNILGDFIGFKDQSPNQEMALEGSQKGTLATLDLSEASDRVSNQLVLDMLTDHPWISKAVQASRSRTADVPGQGIIPLAKFASMGSALCFPVEAMVFLAVIFIGIEKGLGRPLTSGAIRRFRGRVRVYGDDIIVPVDYVASVVESLEAYGFKVNSSKSFWTGKFRESCGKEYYGGEDVSLVRVRREFPTQRQDVREVVSLVSLRNQLYYAGYWRTVKWLDTKLESILKIYPTVLTTSRALGRHSFLGFETQRLGPEYHEPQVRAYVQVSRPPINRLDGEGALLKFLLTRGGLPSADEGHLERSGRPRRVDIKPRWVSSV